VNLPGVDCDLDCSGSTAPPAACDTGLGSTTDATSFAKALGICQTASTTSWGLVSATFTQGYDSTVAPNVAQHSVLNMFGTTVAPREGASLGVMSSGYAQDCDVSTPGSAACPASGTGSPYFKGAQTAMNTATGTPPPGYPKSTATCAVATTIYDTIGVTLQIKVPKNAASLSLDFDFYSSEWPEYVCTNFNDQFVAWLQSEAWGGANGAGDLNIAWDSTGAGISVNTPFLTHCTANTPTGCMGAVTGTAACPSGPNDLMGTGFYNLGTYCTNQSTGGGSTGWLTATAPVKGGETITLQLILWDTGDANWDSSVLVDHLRWYGMPQAAGTKPAM
jgi:hypothetical protein